MEYPTLTMEEILAPFRQEKADALKDVHAVAYRLAHTHRNISSREFLYLVAEHIPAYWFLEVDLIDLQIMKARRQFQDEQDELSEEQHWDEIHSSQ